jgi:hypothetical protein
MATQTRRTTRCSAKFLRATIKGRMIVACCGLVLLGAVAAHAETPRNGLPMNGLPINVLPFNGIDLNGVLLNGIPFNGLPVNGYPIQGLLMNGTPLNGFPATEGSLPTAPSERLPWSTLSHRPLGEAAAPSMSDGRGTLPVELPRVR